MLKTNITFFFISKKKRYWFWAFLYLLQKYDQTLMHAIQIRIYLVAPFWLKQIESKPWKKGRGTELHQMVQTDSKSKVTNGTQEYLAPNYGEKV